MAISAEGKIQGNDESLQSIVDRIVELKAANVYRKSLLYHREQTARRFRRASQLSRYSQGSIGTRQTVTRLIRGQGALFNIDSGAFFRSAIFDYRLRGDGFFHSSNLSYFDRALSHFEKRGFNVLEFTEGDIAVFEGFVDEAVQAAIEG